VALSLAFKRPGCEADHPSPSSSKVKECMELYIHSPNYAFMAWCLIKHRANFTIIQYNSEISSSLLYQKSPLFMFW